MVRVAVGENDLLESPAARKLHGAFQHREVVVPAIAGIEQDLRFARAH